MDNSIDVRSRNYWGLRAQATLFRKFNCPAATMQTYQDMISTRDENVLKAVSGLVGGIVGRGSTCGVVSAGALGLALLYDEALQKNGRETDEAVISLAGDFVEWFTDTYGTTLCEERSGVNFWTLGGLFRYMLPGDRMLPCLSHISGSMKYLYDNRQQNIPSIVGGHGDEETKPIHCAQAVLEGVRANTNIGDPITERISIVFDGGLGLQGGACGALAGAIMAINLHMGMNLREASLPKSYIAFFGGLRYLRADKAEEKADPYDVGKTIVKRFEEEACSLDCKSITGMDFSDWASFQTYMHSSEKCKGLIDLSIQEATSAIGRHTFA
ncbi:MAG: C_GCAxxG_C_C family protein [Anaerolineales bacterium]|nr:C_GCAxxG_C_C family protein [Anaerolineales bacterium]MCK5634482.1 C_GCAxxG_C_C family protein [Anaerolineales bacterium]